MIKTVILIGLLVLTIGTGLVIKDWDYGEDSKLMSKDEIQEQVDIIEERIPLYYNLDNPEKIYTRGAGDEFIEVNMNG